MQNIRDCFEYILRYGSVSGMDLALLMLDAKRAGYTIMTYDASEWHGTRPVYVVCYGDGEEYHTQDIYSAIQFCNGA